MSAQTVTATDIVVIFADLQDGVVNVGRTNDPERLRSRIAGLADLANACALPVIATCVPTTSGAVAPILAEIRTRLPATVALVRTTANAMDDPPFRDALAGSGRKTIIIAGVASEVVVRLTAQSAVRDGYHTIVAVDACSGLDERTESAAFTQLSADGVELSAVATIAAQLAGDFGSATGQAAMRVLQSTLAPQSHDHDDDHDHEHEHEHEHDHNHDHDHDHDHTI